MKDKLDLEELEELYKNAKAGPLWCEAKPNDAQNRWQLGEQLEDDPPCVTVHDFAGEELAKLLQGLVNSAPELLRLAKIGQAVTEATEVTCPACGESYVHEAHKDIPTAPSDWKVSNRIFAAWLHDRAEQYESGSGIPSAIDKLVDAVKAGEVEAAYAHGELDDLLDTIFGEERNKT